ncbi:glycoprotein A33 (transmembrane), paralog a [Aplochiton taeniatus]
MVGAIQVTIPQKLYEVARGDNVTIPCSFIPKTPKPGTVIVTWSLVEDITTAQESTVINYFSNSDTLDVTDQYKGKASLDIDIATGKANLQLAAVTLDENHIFRCHILIPGDNAGKPEANTRLVVLVAPSTPDCKVVGNMEYGQDITLTCKSAEGSPDPAYKWAIRDVNNQTRAPDPKTTDLGGVLSLFNISLTTSGYYTCTSSNKIRSASCSLTLKVMPPSMNVGSTAAIIGGVAAAVLLLVVIIYCCCRRKKKEEAEEYAMGAPEAAEFHDDKEEPAANGGKVRDEALRGAPERDLKSSPVPEQERDRYEARSERDYDRRSEYTDRRSEYDDRRSEYDDRRSEYTDRRSEYADRRSDFDDQRSDRYDRRDRNPDRRERYDDDPRRDVTKVRRSNEDLYDEPYDERPRPPRLPAPANKPARMDYDD